LFGVELGLDPDVLVRFLHTGRGRSETRPYAAWWGWSRGKLGRRGRYKGKFKGKFKSKGAGATKGNGCTDKIVYATWPTANWEHDAR